MRTCAVFEPSIVVTDQNSEESAHLGEAGNHQVSDTYVIPMRRKPGVPGLKPRRRCPSVEPEPSQSTQMKSLTEDRRE